MKEQRGSHFDPDITDAFLESEDRILNIALELADSDEDRRALLR